MHDLESRIAEWRATFAVAPGVGCETLDELESHLRETMDRLVDSGMTETEAFRIAVAQLGSLRTIASEFGKLDPPTWLPVKMVTGLGCPATLALAVFLGIRFGGRGPDLLLGVHVFAVTTGYLTALLIGGLGICFVCQNCFSDFSRARLQSIRQASFVLGSLAAGLTALAIVLGAVWAKLEWGRFWGWDPKETAGLGVLVWLLLFLAAHRLRGSTVRGVLLLGIAGNMIVMLAWFGVNLAAGRHGYGTSQGLMLAAGMTANLAFLLAGFAPAGCLRSGKT